MSTCEGPLCLLRGSPDRIRLCTNVHAMHCTCTGALCTQTRHTGTLCTHIHGDEHITCALHTRTHRHEHAHSTVCMWRQSWPGGAGLWERRRRVSETLRGTVRTGREGRHLPWGEAAAPGSRFRTALPGVGLGSAGEGAWRLGQEGGITFCVFWRTFTSSCQARVHFFKTQDKPGDSESRLGEPLPVGWRPGLREVLPGPLTPLPVTCLGGPA